MAQTKAHPASLRQQRKSSRYQRVMNRAWLWTVSAGLVPKRWPGTPVIGSVTIEVPGRKSGVLRRVPVSWVEVNGAKYLVAMMGEESDWVHNARATGGRITFRRRRRREAVIEELPVEARAAIIQQWYRRVGRSTPYQDLRIEPGAPLSAFEEIAPRWPVWRIPPDALP